METLPDYESILASFDLRELVETLRAACLGVASNNDEHREVLELLHRKRFITLELSHPAYPRGEMPVIEIVGATLTASGGRLLDLLAPSAENEAPDAKSESPNESGE